MITAIIVGAGHRSMCYGSLSLLQPERFKVVGVADPNMLRCKKAAEKFGFGEDMIFHDAAELVKHGKLADCVINGTMDEDHVRTTVPLLEAGYDVLLDIEVQGAFQVKEKMPVIGGIGIVCKGGGDPTVQKKLLDLISAAFGISSNKIYIAEAKK